MTLAFPNIAVDFNPRNHVEFEDACNSFAWYAGNFLYIADKEASEPHLFFLNSAQQELLWYINTFRNSFGGGNYLILKARQEGVSTFVSNYFAWRAFNQPGFKAMTIAHEKQATENLLSMVKLSFKALPDAYPFPDGKTIVVKPLEKASNRKELHLLFDDKGIRDSRIIIEEASAGGEAGISFALNAIHYSEVGKRQFDDGKAVGASMQTLSKNGVAFAEGTADGAFGWMYETWNKGEDDFNNYKRKHGAESKIAYDGWVPIFLPWFYHYALDLAPGETVTPETDFEHRAMSGETMYNNHKCTPEQIKAMRWIMATRLPSTLEMSPDDWRRQEYPSNPQEAFLVSGSTYFKREVIEHGLAWSREYVRKHKFLDIKNWVFCKEPEPNKYRYVIGGDVAEGLEHGDWDTNVVVEIRPNGPNWIVGYWREHEDDKETHAGIVSQMAKRLGSRATAVENNLHGYAVNEWLERMKCKGLYVQTPDDEGSFAKGYTKRYGWQTNKKTRGRMLSIMASGLLKWHLNPKDPEGLACPFPEIWDEIRAFVKINRKAEAAPGNHDDLVIASAIACAVADDVVPKAANPKKKKRSEGLIHLRHFGLKHTARFLSKFERQGT